VISQPFWPAYLTAERIAKAKKLKLAITAGIGSDHVDLEAAIKHGVTVAEVTYSNSISVSEHVVMMILSLVRNYIPSHQWVIEGGWNIADCVARSYDLEGMHVGTVAAGRIGSAVLRRLKPFDVKLHYTDRHRLPESVEKELGVTHHPDVESLVRVCDVVTINAPLHPETEHLFNDALIGKMKRGAYLVNTARGKICDRDAVVRALNSGQLAGYAGDVWFP
jgi:formate dehydrogenase